MKPNSAKITAVKKTTARTKVIDAQEQLDAQAKIANLSNEEYCRKVADKAYELFERRGYQHGYDREDWFQAERLVQEGFTN